MTEGPVGGWMEGRMGGVDSWMMDGWGVMQICLGGAGSVVRGRPPPRLLRRGLAHVLTQRKGQVLGDGAERRAGEQGRPFAERLPGLRWLGKTGQGWVGQDRTGWTATVWCEDADLASLRRPEGGDPWQVALGEWPL